MTGPTPKRRIPVQSVRDSDDETTKKLRLLFYLGEVERQAEIYNEATEEAVEAWRRGAHLKTIWRHLQAALFAAIVVNRLVTNKNPQAIGWPCSSEEETNQSKKEATKAAKWRVRELKRLLNLPSDPKATPIYTVAKIRNSLEHIDERIDLAFSSANVASLSDFYISDGTLLVSPEDASNGDRKTGLRAFHPESASLFFDQESLSFLCLDLEMRKLRHKTREAQAELINELKGRRMFGGLQATRVPASATDPFVRWEREKRRIAEVMAHPPHYGNIVLWAELDMPHRET
ncbi:hypothetical protein [Micromonospora sp. CB01531]|uniref:hypothetical protein n=1 Tax=Micromonospora sp. CB01531 TaxID=1718947 RepID=UPI000B25D431|nr:hypothetical protein [Micromonospora sp. CB01531]